MKQSRSFKVVLAFFLFVFVITSVAVAENKYISIQEILATAPTRWQGEYTSVQGETVNIDTPIVIPDVEQVPIVRVTWGGPYEITDPTLVVETNNANLLFLTFPNVSNDRIFLEQAPEIFLKKVYAAFPELQDRNFQLYASRQFSTSQAINVNFYSTYHGIPYCIGDLFGIPLAGENSGDLPVVPALMTYGSFWRNPEDTHPGHNLFLSVCSPKEVGVDIDDVPLLPFTDIIKTFEQWIEEGYVYSLDEMRFAYMIFIDPDKKGDEFLLFPVWVAKGITRGFTDIPFHPDSNPDTLAATGYQMKSICAINAQTGEKFDFVGDSRETRQYVPKIITWDEVK